jgi:acyl-[acyl carrier protein]--UDP-N-acetylglucosamine O-acyltransferase
MPKTKSQKGIAKKVFYAKLIAVRGRSSNRSKRNAGLNSNTMSKSKTPQSVVTALNEARSALYSQQFELIRNCQRIQRSIDSAVEAGKEVDSFDINLLAEAKGKLADTILARETQFDIPNL